MNSRFIIIAILIMIKVVGVASHARVNFCESMYNNTDDAFFGYDDGSEWMYSHISECNKESSWKSYYQIPKVYPSIEIQDLLKSKGIY